MVGVSNDELCKRATREALRELAVFGELSRRTSVSCSTFGGVGVAFAVRSATEFIFSPGKSRRSSRSNQQT